MRSGSIALASALALALSIGACAPVRPTARSSATEICHRVSGACGPAPSPPATDVSAVLEERCFKCHSGDGVAADEHDFSREETLRAQRSALAAAVGACAMPPASEPPLTDDEAEVLLRWAACGGP